MTSYMGWGVVLSRIQSCIKPYFRLHSLGGLIPSMQWMPTSLSALSYKLGGTEAFLLGGGTGGLKHGDNLATVDCRASQKEKHISAQSFVAWLCAIVPLVFAASGGRQEREKRRRELNGYGADIFRPSEENGAGSAQFSPTASDIELCINKWPGK